MTPPSASPVRDELLRWLQPGYLWWRLRHNFLAKMLALALALLLWSLTTADRRAQVTQTFDVPIIVRDTTNEDGTRAISGLNPTTLKVSLRGLPDRLKELRGPNIEAVLDVSGLPEGSFTRTVTVIAPRSTTLTGGPYRVQGVVDSQESRTLPIAVSVASPPENSFPRYSVSPAEAMVSGPRRVMEKLHMLSNSPVTLSGDEQQEVPLLVLDASGRPISGLKVTPATATLRRIDSGEVPVKALKVVLNDPPAGLKVTAISLQPSSVRVVAAPALLARLREVPGKVTYREGTYSVPVDLKVPPGSQALEEVNVTLTVERVKGGKAPAKP